MVERASSGAEERCGHCGKQPGEHRIETENRGVFCGYDCSTQDLAARRASGEPPPAESKLRELGFAPKTPKTFA